MGLAEERSDAAPRQRISEVVAQRIRDHMLIEKLQPGDRLGREEDLAREFGVSRPTLREALRLLSSAHLIRASKGPGGGIFVAAMPLHGIGMSVSTTVASMLDSDSIGLEELLETRMLLEIPLAGLAAQRAVHADILALNDLIEAQARTTDAAVAHRLDAQVHRMIAEIAGNRLAAAFTEWVVDVLQPRLRAAVESAVVESAVVDQHRDLLEAIAHGDSIAAERAMREHLLYARDLLTAIAGAAGDANSDQA
jgi:GntR family transcriptional repressor for pyruvate dehydrogenase complex